METTAPSVLRRLVLPLALLVPLVVDPFGLDTLTTERLVLCLVGAVLLGLEAAEGLFGRRASLLLATPEALLVALVTWGAASTLWATNAVVGTSMLVMLLAVLGVARTVRAAVAGPAPARAWIAALVTVAVVAMAVDAVAIRDRAPDLSQSGATKYASLLFGHNNVAGNYAVVLLPLSAALLLGGQGLQRLLGLAGTAGGVAYLVLLGNRSGILIAAAGLPLVVLAFVLRKRLVRMRFTGRAAGTALAVVVLVLAVLPFSEQARGLGKDAFYAATRTLEEYGVSDLQDSGFRPDLFKKTVAMAQEAPLRGVGVANWAVEYPRYERHIQDRPHAHNDALQVLAELGIPGLVLFLALFGSLVLTQLRILTTARSPGAFACGVGLLGSTIAFLLCGLFEVPFTMGSTASVLGFVVGVTTRLGETGGRVSSLRPNPLTALLVIGLSTAGAAYVVQRMPASWRAAQAEEAITEKNYDVAAARLEDIARMRTGSWVPEARIAQLDNSRGHHEAALLHIRAARALSPFKTDLMRIEGEALMALGREDEAVDVFKEASDAAPGDEARRSEYIEALVRAGRLREAIGHLEYSLQSRLRTVDVDAIVRLAKVWRTLAEETTGPERVEALAAARHFYAVALEDGPASLWAELAQEFKHVTHLLQVMPGSPDCWWPTYERFLRRGGWHRPSTALWTAMDGDGVKLYPGWEEPAGPPLPRELRNLP